MQNRKATDNHQKHKNNKLTQQKWHYILIGALLILVAIIFATTTSLNQNNDVVNVADPATDSVSGDASSPTPIDSPSPPRIDSQSPSVRAENDGVSPPPDDPTPMPVTIDVSPETEPVVVDVPQEPVEDQVIIQFDPEATDEEREEFIESIGGTVSESIDELDTVIVTVSEEVAAEPLPDSSVVADSEPDHYISALEEDLPPNDPLFYEQWALPVIGAPDAWFELPDDAPTYTVAVIDSGICMNHPDLEGRIGEGWDFLEDDSTPQDEFGHGCAVSGVIAAINGNGIGIAGVAPNTMIMPLRVLDANGIGTYSDVAAAIVYAVDNGLAGAFDF